MFEWIYHITGEDSDALPDGYEIKEIHEKLKDGVILCKYIYNTYYVCSLHACIYAYN